MDWLWIGSAANLFSNSVFDEISAIFKVRLNVLISRAVSAKGGKSCLSILTRSVLGFNSWDLFLVLLCERSVIQIMVQRVPGFDMLSSLLHILVRQVTRELPCFLPTI